MILCVCVCVCVFIKLHITAQCVCVCVFIELPITAQSGPGVSTVLPFRKQIGSSFPKGKFVE